MIQLAVYFFIGLIFMLLDIFFIRYRRNVIKAIVSFCFFTLFINIFSIGLLVLFLNKINAFMPDKFHSVFAIQYFAFACMIGLITLLIEAVITKRLTFSPILFKKKGWKGLLDGVMLIMLIVSMLVIFLTSWFLEQYGLLTPIQVVSKFNTLSQNVAASLLGELFSRPILKALFYAMPVVLFIAFNRFDITWHTNHSQFTLKRATIQFCLLAIITALFISSIYFCVTSLHLLEVVRL